MAGNAAVPIGMMAKAAMVEVTAWEPAMTEATTIKGNSFLGETATSYERAIASRSAVVDLWARKKFNNQSL